jgi:hypothetical protein
VIPAAAEGYGCAVRRPPWGKVVTGIFGEVFRFAPVFVHDVDFPVPIPIGHEDNLCVCRRLRVYAWYSDTEQ